MKIIIEKLETPFRDGDWHDPLFKWVVKGPRDNERQHFYTKKEAQHYATIRRCSDSQLQAIHSYAIGM